ncbi:hypothetical protein [Xenorhabdus bovienii]|uniref:hypothetical protein n=1 Tax=Xenorhabdus bovienii TaxID=40576 RepID=UPI00237CC650|nr:hypothetical protein [Xenorhabdus bovienii]MDE1483436.1 hypothetical protein [Xenorhabdus bovienii]MDE9460199.1 hypothetical protein [Xenorhabdus bovienii]MDE9468447.1 hypothetical protein [Xenorhabdus bovienii]MDE9486025.1 hypothetical protein [Xenorhabdus bovienii]
MSNQHVDWLKNIEHDLVQNDGRDLYDIIHESLLNEKISFPNFLFNASNGHGFSPSEGCGYALDQDWDIPEEFDNVAFFFGDFESSEIPPNQFVMLMQHISDAYINVFPDSKEVIERNMKRLRERYA